MRTTDGDADAPRRSDAGPHQALARPDAPLPDALGIPNIAAVAADPAPAVEVEGLAKRFDDTVALDGLDLEVATGTILGLLGPNGAGKTTTINVLSTLLVPDAGTARVCGHDVVTEAPAVRRSIALTGQYAAVDDELTGAENLVLFARLLGLDRTSATARATDLLDRLDLADAAATRAKAYSGGMRRRLDLAASLVVPPRVLFLDEPTTGLDPASRLALWDVVRGLRDDGVTILLTTQYLEEADVLADRIVVIDHGRVIAEGSADQLKATVGGTVLEIVPADPASVGLVAEALGAVGPAEVADGRVSLPAPDGPATLTRAVAALDARGVVLADVTLRRPSLDDVFLVLTGHQPSTERADADRAPKGTTP